MSHKFKIKNLKFNHPYTIEELYEKIKETPFSAGTPSLLKYMGSTLIAFPPLDSENQIQISKLGFRPASNTYTIQKSYDISMVRTGTDFDVYETMEDPLGLTGMLEGNAHECFRLVDETAKELWVLDL